MYTPLGVKAAFKPMKTLRQTLMKVRNCILEEKKREVVNEVPYKECHQTYIHPESKSWGAQTGSETRGPEEWHFYVSIISTGCSCDCITVPFLSNCIITRLYASAVRDMYSCECSWRLSSLRTSYGSILRRPSDQGQQKAESTSVYRKPTHMDRYIPFHSHSHQRTITSVLRCMRDMPNKICDSTSEQ